MAQVEVNRSEELRTSLNPARNAGESFEDYKVRRAAANKVLKMRLKGGSYFYENKFVPVPGTEDPETGQPVLKGIPYVKSY